MTTLTAGSTANFSLSGRQVLQLTADNNTTGTIKRTQHVESVSSKTDTLGPPATNRTYGAYGHETDIEITCTYGSFEYDITGTSLVTAETNELTGGITGLTSGGADLGVSPTKQGRRIAFVGDSLTEAARLPIPFLPAGVPPFQALTPATISSTYLISYAPLLGVPSGTGTIECDTSGRLRYTAPSDTAGPWVDATAGGHFLLYSGTAVYMCYALTRYTGHAGVTLPVGSTASDNVTLSGFPSTNNWYNLTGWPAWVVGLLQSEPVEVWGFALTGDTLADIAARKTRVAQFATDNGFKWDDIVLMGGANDVVSTGTTITTALLSLVDYFASIASRVHVCEILPQGAAVATASRQHIVDANRRLADGCRSRQYNVKLVQTYNQMVDNTSTTGDVVVTPNAGAKYYTDGVHLMANGAMIVGQAVVNSLRPYYPIRKFVTTSGADAYHATDNPNGNWISNGKLLGGTDGTLGGTAVAPTGWTLSGTGVAIAYQTAATILGADDNGGSFLEMTAPSAITGELNISPTVNAVAGDVFELSGEVVQRGSTGATMTGIQCNFASAAAPNANYGPYFGQSSRNLSDISNSGLLKFSQRLVVPASPGATTTVRLRATAASTKTAVAAFRNIVLRKVS